jgi:hypothetical protein
VARLSHVIPLLFSTILSAISPRNHIRLSNHARDAFGRFGSDPISLPPFFLGLFVDAACMQLLLRDDSKVNGSLSWLASFVLVAVNQVDGGCGLGSVKAWWAYVRR